MTIGLDITVLNDKNRTGVGVYTYQLIKSLLEEDTKNKYILFGFSTLSTYNYLKNIDLKNYPNVQIKVIPMPAKFFRLAFIFWQKINFPKIENLIGKVVDCYISFNFYFPPQSKGGRVATVFDLTSINNSSWHQSKTSQLDNIRMQRIKDLADLVITISESSKKDFLQFASSKRVEVIYPSLKELSNSQSSSQTRSGIQNRYILSVATLEPRKNLDSLIKAFNQLKLDADLVLVGGAGWKSEELKMAARKNPRIKLLGFVSDDELANLYNKALMFVYPSFYEGFGLPVLEALSFKVPTICSNTSSLPEVGGKGVYYIDPSSVESLRIAILELAKNGKLRAKLAKDGFAQSQKFNNSKSAKTLLAVLENLKTNQ